MGYALFLTANFAYHEYNNGNNSNNYKYTDTNSGFKDALYDLTICKSNQY